MGGIRWTDLGRRPQGRRTEHCPVRKRENENRGRTSAAPPQHGGGAARHPPARRSPAGRDRTGLFGCFFPKPLPRGSLRLLPLSLVPASSAETLGTWPCVPLRTSSSPRVCRCPRPWRNSPFTLSWWELSCRHKPRATEQPALHSAHSSRSQSGAPATQLSRGSPGSGCGPPMQGVGRILLEAGGDAPDLDSVSLIPCLSWLTPSFGWSTSSSSLLRKKGNSGTLRLYKDLRPS